MIQLPIIGGIGRNQITLLGRYNNPRQQRGTEEERNRGGEEQRREEQRGREEGSLQGGGQLLSDTAN